MSTKTPLADVAYAEFTKFTRLGRRRAITRHINGTCKCYVPLGQGRNGTRESGKDCVFSRMNGQQQNAFRMTAGLS